MQYKIYPSLLDAYNWYASSESETATQELIDKINRLPFQSDAADRGTCFNKLIDAELEGRERFGFNFVTGLAKDICDRLEGAQRQLFVSTVIEVDGVMVELYGYLDYLKYDIVTDLKTTKQYELGKYKDGMQRHVYPVALIDHGNQINNFEFLVTDFNVVYPELYPVDYDKSKAIIVDSCRQLIRFLETHKDIITDKKIFNQDK